MEQSLEILLAEDEDAVREALVVHLQCEGYTVRAVADGEAALAAFKSHRPDLLLLDVMMPKQNGYAVCEAVRALDAQVPIIFLTALSDDMDQLRGLKLGADDFVKKTEKVQILLARIATVLRRTGSVKEQPTVPELTYRVGTCLFDPMNTRIVDEYGKEEELSWREVEVLRELVLHPGEMLSRDYLLTKFWGMESTVEENTLSILIHRLRDKLGESGKLLQTVYGKGYSLRPKLS